MTGPGRSTTTMPDAPDSPRKVYRLNPRALERAIHPPVAPAEPDPALPAVPPAADSAPPLPIHHPSHRPSEDPTDPTVAPAEPAPAAPDEMLLPPPRRSRRRRDYWVLMLASNLVFVFTALHVGPDAPLLFVATVAGMLVCSAALTWVMWFVMDDY